MKPHNAVLARLSSAQRAALSHVEATVRGQEEAARSRVVGILSRAGCTTDTYDQAMKCIELNARVVVHFHPDRFGHKSTTVADLLLNEGVYRNQFETGLSSGSLSAYPGGLRDTWEKALFGGAYHVDGVTGSERPKYGALELVRHPDGPTPRFGSCYLVLRPDVSQRTSFTFMGSEDPRATQRLGVMGRMDGVMAALLLEVEQGGMATPSWPPFRAPTLGIPELTVPRLLEFINTLSQPRRDPAEAEPGRVLDSAVEAHVHGLVHLREDVELLVADPAFVGTAVGTILLELGRYYEIPVRWHNGFRLLVSDVPDDFRGPAMPRLAQRIAGKNGAIDAAVIGSAAASLHQHPEVWQDWDAPAETLQHLKQLWHVLVQFGSPALGTRGTPV